MLSTNISSNQLTRADRQTLNQHTMKSSGNSQKIFECVEENFNFEMIGTGIRTLGTGVQILVYCQTVFIDSGYIYPIKDLCFRIRKGPKHSETFLK